MAVCDVCHNDYDKAFRVQTRGEEYTFDSFECAIHKLAPRCSFCDCRVIGHGVEADGAVYCCGNCAKAEGETRIRDRVETPPRRVG